MRGLESRNEDRNMVDWEGDGDMILYKSHDALSQDEDLEEREVQ